jgi:hypothetical protein
MWGDIKPFASFGCQQQSLRRYTRTTLHVRIEMFEAANTIMDENQNLYR